MEWSAGTLDSKGGEGSRRLLLYYVCVLASSEGREFGQRAIKEESVLHALGDFLPGLFILFTCTVHNSITAGV